MPQSIIGLINQWTQSNLDIFPPSNIYNVLVGTNLNPTGFKFLVVGQTKIEGDLTITGSFNGSISNIKVVNKTDNNNYQLVFVDNDGNQIPLYTNNQITYNPSSNTFVVGNLTSNISTSTGYLTSNLSGLLQNNQLQNDDIIIDGINLELGSTNSQLAFDLVNSTGYLTSNLVGLLQNNQLQNDDIIIDGINLELGSSYSQLALDATNFINLNPANINITNTTTNQNYYLVFCDSAGTNKILRLDNAGIKYNPSTKVLTIDKILSTLDSQFDRQINLTGNQTAILGRPQINFGGDAFSSTGFSIRTNLLGSGLNPYLTELKSNKGDIQIESAGLITLLSNDIELKGNVGINTDTPSVSLDIDTTDAVKLPVGTTAERPTPQNGMIRYNEDGNDFEGCKNDVWTSLSGATEASFQFTQTDVVVAYPLTYNTPKPLSLLTVSITPISTSSVIRIESHIFGEFDFGRASYDHNVLLGRSINGGPIEYLRNSNSSAVSRGITSFSTNYHDVDDDSTAEVCAMVYYDQPNTILPTTYTVYIQTGNLTVTYFNLNRVIRNTTAVNYEYGVSNMSASDGAGVASAATTLWNLSGPSNIYYDAGSVSIGDKLYTGTNNIFNVFVINGTTFNNNSQNFATNIISHDDSTRKYGLVISNTNNLLTSNKKCSIGFGNADTANNVKIGNSIESITNDFNAITSDLVFKTLGSSDGYSANTESMRITSAGRLGLGVPTPLYKLHILGDVKCGNTSSNNIALTIEENNSYKYQVVIGGWFAGARYGQSTIQNSVNLHIDSPGNGPIGLGHIYLNWFNSGANTYVRNRIDVSDKRIKKDIIKIEDVNQINKTFETIKNIGSYTYKYRDIYRENHLDQYGFIAQEVVKHYPVASKLTGNNCYLPNIMETLNFSYTVDDNNKYNFTIENYELDLNTKYLFYGFKENDELFDYLENIQPININSFSYTTSDKPVYVKLVLVGTYTNDKIGVSKDKLFQLGFAGVNGLIIENENMKKEISNLKNEIELIKEHLNL